jgi:diguanylate cyclase (GGDEF)-like protein/putative nucleotidyltransferase with HDIG domain
MNRRSPRVQLAIVVAGAVAVCLAAAWYVPLTWPASALTIPLLLVALGALAIAYVTYRRATAIIADQQAQLASSASLRLEIIEALSLAIDARHRSTQSIKREQAYAAALARVFGMSEEEVECIRTAALLHDVGKLAVPDHILTKPGPLTPDEQRKVRIHPDIGAGIIAGVSFPYPVAALIRSHHEHWDGSGYPGGVKGNQIPLGARILTCVDYFEALTADRPFHKAKSVAEAVDILWAEAGKALDPVVVARFVELLPSLPGSAEDAAWMPKATARAAVDGAPPVSVDDQAIMRDIGSANREIRGLYELSRAIGSTLGVTDAVNVIAEKLGEVMPFGACALFLLEPAEGLVRCRHATGDASEALRRLTIPKGAGVIGQVVASQQGVTNGDPAADAAIAGVDSAGLPFASVLACPLVVGETAMGALALYAQKAGAFSDEQRRLLGLVSEQAAAVIANSVVFEKTQVDSVTDALTGLPNIRLLFAYLNRELARASRLATPVSLLLMDLDNLKDINDTYGHSTGDHALCRVAGVLGSAIRPYDLCVRYGGDEFIVVLSDCGRDEAQAKLIELQQAVEAIVFEVQGRQRVRLRISGGAAVFPQDGQAYETLVATADRRMYEDKAARKQANGRPAAAKRALPFSDVELDRAAAGVL